MNAMVSSVAAAAGLQSWAQGHAPHVAAAVGLLVDHGVWLRRRDFREVCVELAPDGECWIDWPAAREALEAREFAASTTETAVLDLALALGENRYRLSLMNLSESRAVVAAVARAAGVSR
ncbi:hypothetical protein [Pseudonocardia sp. N23]|uniref:hypothetical protein n=1 Tax=Pseudonocardia sp. N23 TaxID=1987376 RepID=UPI000BFB4484|nr:hypothetical protein [Pseudonocardia sp. N23]GAY11650.1 hypothetical protein TOK_0033 [Pseudonocardia sp. N23]